MHEHLENQDRVFQQAPDDGAALRWLKVHARYLRVHMNGRALVSVWLPGDRKLQVDQVLALGDGGIVLQGTLDDGTEVHVTRTSEALSLEMRPAPEGTLCTGFAFIGVSRTPQPFLDRTTTPPPPPHEPQDDGLARPTPPHEDPGHGGDH